MVDHIKEINKLSHNIRIPESLDAFAKIHNFSYIDRSLHFTGDYTFLRKSDKLNLLMLSNGYID